MLAFPNIEEFSLSFLLNVFKNNVLVVEDDPFLKPLITKIVASADSKAEVHWARSAELAMHRLENHHYGLVIADYFLEGNNNGLDLYNYCKAKFPKTPFLLMSSMEPGTMKKLNKKGASFPPFLHKPFMIDDCLKTITRMLHLSN